MCRTHRSGVGQIGINSYEVLGARIELEFVRQFPFRVLNALLSYQVARGRNDSQVVMQAVIHSMPTENQLIGVGNDTGFRR